MLNTLVLSSEKLHCYKWWEYVTKLRSLEEMYEEYVEIFHGNGYVKTLMERVRKLPIVGKLDY